ncbi:ArsR/SmtB family transcription factor [Priestia megaterium]|uniref:ArsR/SmtB family transcription factor n=1 Tax=Priestia megaterium TaxID=1404 RepID=UPI00203AFAAE|nr:metalloregulator ArsR/SmtB family transcription factor [Priestia megaterium]MCM3185955.1 metalloregulator ArsR/SmtB family transcription factor [Priestia megaterium]
MDTKASIEMEKAAQILKVFGDKTRLSMMKILQTNECCVGELVEIYKASQPAMSQHLRKLKDIGLVKEKRKGHWIFYSINQTYKHYDFLVSILNSLPSQDDRLIELEKQGLRISCC